MTPVAAARPARTSTRSGTATPTRWWPLMAIDYADALARSRDVPAFANGTEGHGWMANWCDRCLRDAPFRNIGTGSGCPLILVALQGRTPAEWLDGPRDEHGAYSIAGQYSCVEFKA